MVTELYYFIPRKGHGICDLENNLVGNDSIAKINWVAGSNMEKIIWWLQMGNLKSKVLNNQYSNQ